MRKKLLTAALAVVVIVMLVLRVLQPDLRESVARSELIHAEIVKIVSRTFGVPSSTERYWNSSTCGNLNGPTGEEALVLVADWELTGFEEERVTVALGEVEAFLAQMADPLEWVVSTGASGDLILEARGRLLSFAVAGPAAPDAERFEVGIATYSVCGEPSSLAD